MQSQKPPQIIVIPSSLLNQQKTTPIKISPSSNSPFKIITSSPQSLNRAIISPNSVSSQMTLNRAVLSPTIPSLAKKIQPIITTKPIATVVGNKRPAPVESPTFESDDIKCESDFDNQPVRKRANLDHLSPEERLMRRKLKNRVAAQTARDKKKAQTDEMEKLISELQEEKSRLQLENNRLQATNTQLQIENANLQQENDHLRNKMSPVKFNPSEVLEVELPPSPASLPPASPISPQTRLSSPTPSLTRPLLTPICPPLLQPPESAELTYEPQQQEQGCNLRNRLGISSLCPQSLTGLSSRDLTPWTVQRKAKMDCLTVILYALSCLMKMGPSFTSPPPSPPPSPITTLLPLKKDQD